MANIVTLVGGLKSVSLYQGLTIRGMMRADRDWVESIYRSTATLVCDKVNY